MLFLPHFPLLQRSPLLMVVVDSGLLVVTLCPVLWMLVIRPLRVSAVERGELLRQQFAVQEVERSRLARELHDELGQIQTAILLTARASKSSQSTEDLQEHMASIQNLASSAVEATRRIAKGLSPGVLQDFGLGVALARMIEECGVVGGPEISFDAAIRESRFDPEIELAVYRVVQEAVLNAVKHSSASRIAVSIAQSGSEVVATVSDNGKGIHHLSKATRAGGLGLWGMRERLELVNGTLSIEVQPEQGTIITGRVPAKVMIP